jgi:hypothetical protein
VARACYFVQSHRGPEQVARLVATIKASSPDAYVLVGHDARHSALSRADLPALPGLDLFHVEGPVQRGRLSLLSPYFQAIDRLVAAGVDYDWLVYLSGQDYPTASLARSEASWRASAYDGFLTYWDAFGHDNPWGRKRQGVLRYGYRYTDTPPWTFPALRALRFLNGLQSVFHLHSTYGPKVGVRARRTPFGADRVCYAGSQWTTLSRPCVEHVVERLRAEPELIAYYERCICADESLVQTVLVNSGKFRLAPDNLRYADIGSRRDGVPRTLTLADYDTLSDDRCQFARKFDPAVDAAILERLDERIAATA